jgi:hypothetical protein
MRSAQPLAALLLAALTLFACARPVAEPPRHPQPAEAEARNPEVRVHGALREMMHEGRLEARVALSDVAGPHVYGVGALSELRGEVTFVDGEAWLSYPDGEDAFRLEVTTEPEEAAALLVVSTVTRCLHLPFGSPAVAGPLDATVARMAGEAGLDLDAPFPFLVTGPVEDLDWHVIDGSRIPPDARGHRAHIENSVRGRLASPDVTLVGFHSRRHRRIFTHMDRDTHLHVVARDEGITGHVDHVVVLEGATLWLPAEADASP